MDAPALVADTLIAGFNVSGLVTITDWSVSIRLYEPEAAPAGSAHAYGPTVPLASLLRVLMNVCVTPWVR